MKQGFMICVFVLTADCIFAQSKVELSKPEEEFKRSEKELDDVYNKILNEYKSDTVFIKHLKKSQNLWIQFRNVEMEMKYPNTLNGRYSTPYVMCTYSYKERLTRERINALNVWLKGTERWSECDGNLKERN